MEYRRLGQSGLKVSAVGLGCNNFGMRMDYAQTEAVVNRAIELGINLFDTADIYGGTQSEQFLGKALGKRRHEVVIATKVGMPLGDALHERGASRRRIMYAVEQSLGRLNTDYIDLYQIHQVDPETPIAETLAALDDLVRQGKVRYIGHSNFSGWQIADAAHEARQAGGAAFVSAQNLYSLLDRRSEKEVLPACEHYGIGMLPYFPLASGMLTGKYKRGEPAPEGTRLAAFGERGQRAMSDVAFDTVEQLTEFAHQHEQSILDLAFGWLLSKPIISSVIAGATSPEQLSANAAAGLSWRLNAEEMNTVNQMSKR